MSKYHEAGIAVGTETLPAIVVAIGVGAPRSIVGNRQGANQGGLLPLVGVRTFLTFQRRSMRNLSLSFNRLKTTCTTSFINVSAHLHPPRAKFV